MEIRGPYSYHIATELSGLLCKFGEFPCVHQSVGAMMFWPAFAPFSKELIAASTTRGKYEDSHTYVGIKYLNLTKGWVDDEDTGSGLSDKPVTSEDIKRRTVQRVGMDGRSNYWKSREYCQTCSEGTAMTKTVRGIVQRMWSWGHAPAEEF